MHSSAKRRQRHREWRRGSLAFQRQSRQPGQSMVDDSEYSYSPMHRLPPPHLLRDEVPRLQLLQIQYSHGLAHLTQTIPSKDTNLNQLGRIRTLRRTIRTSYRTTQTPTKRVHLPSALQEYCHGHTARQTHQGCPL
jgi:hypothetical protein